MGALATFAASTAASWSVDLGSWAPSCGVASFASTEMSPIPVGALATFDDGCRSRMCCATALRLTPNSLAIRRIDQCC